MHSSGGLAVPCAYQCRKQPLIPGNALPSSVASVAISQDKAAHPVRTFAALLCGEAASVVIQRVALWSITKRETTSVLLYHRSLSEDNPGPLDRDGVIDGIEARGCSSIPGVYAQVTDAHVHAIRGDL